MPTGQSIYLDNHATTRLDPRVFDAMLPLLQEDYANPGSTTHELGRGVRQQVEQSIDTIASLIGAEADEIVVTSGATESNNLALFGAALHPRQLRRKIVTLATEHRAVLDPVSRLERAGFEVLRLPVLSADSELAGMVDLDLFAKMIDHETALVSVMIGNNEIGTIQALSPLVAICREKEVLFHADASQAFGKIPIDVKQLDVDLLSFSAHKFYGPKGVGGLYVRRTPRLVRLQPQIWGGGQQSNLRSGTLNSPGIVGMASALQISVQEMEIEQSRIARLRDLLWSSLTSKCPGIRLNGPTWRSEGGLATRLAGNLNVCFPKVEGQSIMLSLPQLAMSSGSACTSADPHPSHVLMAIGRSEDEARSSLRFGIGRFNTEEEIRIAADQIAEVHAKLSGLVA